MQLHDVRSIGVVVLVVKLNLAATSGGSKNFVCACRMQTTEHPVSILSTRFLLISILIGFLFNNFNFVCFGSVFTARSYATSRLGDSKSVRQVGILRK